MYICNSVQNTAFPKSPQPMVGGWGKAMMEHLSYFKLKKYKIIAVLLSQEKDVYEFQNIS